MFWRKSTYIFSDDYESLTNNLFTICKLENQKIKFIEVCNVSGRQLCIKRRAIMKELLSNNRGDIFFKGVCRALKKERFFELILMEYEINGKVTDTNSWFLKATGTSRYLHNKMCARLNSTQVWEGKSELTKFTDVFSEVQEGLIVQRTAKRNVYITKIFRDTDEQFYVASVDIDNNETTYSYMMDVTLETHGQKYTFDAWCKKFTGFSPDNYLSTIENFDGRLQELSATRLLN